MQAHRSVECLLKPRTTDSRNLEIIMGITQVTVTIRNPADPERAWDGLFLVDTGAIDCLVPRQHLEAIGLKPKGQRTYELADGSEIKMDITTGDIEFMGEVVGGTIIFGDADSEPILGVTALESVGIEVDPQNQQLKRMPAVRLKSMKGA
jgi:clan AA aspartic protease